jgi:AcrR family transcriptional regulator
MTGRPRSFDRDQALARAVETFWADGYEGTSIAQLTEVMGISPPSLYAAFGDKRRLFGEAVDSYSENLNAAVDASLAQPDVHEAIADLLRKAAEHYTEPGHPPGCLVMSEPSLTDARAAVRELVARRIGRAIDEGEVPAAVDPEKAARFIEAILFGMSAQARDGSSREELLEAAAQGARASLLAYPRP